MKTFLALASMLALAISVSAARTVELGFPGLEQRVKVSLPENHQSGGKHPVILFYHGQGGKVDTAWMRQHCGANDWIVVGMTYYQRGKMSLEASQFSKELTLLRSVKRHLTQKYAADPKRIYVAGFSKGGWMSDLMLQSDSSLAGGVILAGGHLHTLKASRGSAVARRGRPVFVGTGRLDPNYPHAYNALLFHRKRGMKVTLDVWEGIGHSAPQDGINHLMQWLSLRIPTKPGLKEVCQSTTLDAWDEAMKLAPAAQWRALQKLKDAPYTHALSKEWSPRIEKKLTELAAMDSVKPLAQTRARLQKLLYREITQRDVKSIAEVQTSYRNLAATSIDKIQRKAAANDAKRAEQLLTALVKTDEQRRVAKAEMERLRREQEKNKPKIKPVVPTPGKGGRIPVRPIFR